MKQVIVSTSLENKFISFWLDDDCKEIPDSRIILDFNPVIQAAKLTENFIICHYQARPKGLRKWGLCYQSKYHSVEKINSLVPYESVWLDEKSIFLPPNAVLVHKNCELVLTGAIATIKAIA